MHGFEMYLNTVIFQQISKAERQTPLAFSILAHDQFPLLETLIALLFRPHNSYCIFVDAKAAADYENLVQKLVNCYRYKFPKVGIFSLI